VASTSTRIDQLYDCNLQFRFGDGLLYFLSDTLKVEAYVPDDISYLAILVFAVVSHKSAGDVAFAKVS
jgi:hypothetical protein